MLLLGGCQKGPEGPNQAAILINAMHDAIKTQNWDEAKPLYGKRFFARTTWADWREKLDSLHKRFGTLNDVKVVFEQKNPRLGGDFFIYGFKLMFERGVVHETLTVYHKDGGDRLFVTEQLFKYKDDVL